MTSGIMKFCIISLTSFFLYCNGEDTKGEIFIEYSGDWNATITENYLETNITGNGNRIFTYTNPDNLNISATKLDSSQNKLTIYIYENERIVVGDSTRIPEGSVTTEYEFPF